MRKSFALLIIIIPVLFTWYWEHSKYDRLMSDALKKKKAHPEQKFFDGEAEPPLPNREENDRTILGIDSNKNGIRDDVDIWINRTALDYNERMAMRQYARTIQEDLRICKDVEIEKMSMAQIAATKDEITLVAKKYINASQCLSAISDKQHGERNLERKLEILIKNSKSRLDCPEVFEKFNYIAQGSYFEPLKNCNYPIEPENDVIKASRGIGGDKK